MHIVCSKFQFFYAVTKLYILFGMIYIYLRVATGYDQKFYQYNFLRVFFGMNIKYNFFKTIGLRRKLYGINFLFPAFQLEVSLKICIKLGHSVYIGYDKKSLLDLFFSLPLLM